MRQGEQIGDFGQAVDAALKEVKPQLPSDLIVARTSDQPLQVEENVELFMNSLYEAIALVVLVSFIGFWEWRSALLMALSHPDHAGDDVRHDGRARHRPAAGLDRDADHRAWTCWWTIRSSRATRSSENSPPGSRALVAAWLGPTKLRDGDPVRDDHEHRRVSAVPAR